jgi:hypothetical protein
MTDAPLPGLKNFDPKIQYGYREGMKVMSKQNTGKQMGMITNLITDMTLQGADDDELARAVRHSMVVIDANKHRLDYERSYIDNNIAQLKKKYQPGENGKAGGAHTLLSSSKSEVHLTDRERITGDKGIDPETGEILYRDKTTYHDKKLRDGTIVKEANKPITSTRMFEAKDARELSSGHEMEEVYADYANYMKALGNRARLESLKVPDPVWNRGATTLAYKDEIKSLDDKLDIALRNAPRERRAQLIANYEIQKRKEEDPSLADDKEAMKKVRNNALRDAREVSGAKKEPIVFSDKEWEAIQAGAISKTKQDALFNNCDPDALKARALPKEKGTITPATKNRIKAMLDAGWTTKELAEKFDVSTSTISKIKKEGE